MFSSVISMLACEDGDVGFRGWRKAQAVNQVSEERGKMARAFLKAKWDPGQLLVALDQFHPVLNRSIEVMLQDGGHAFAGQRPVGYRVGEFFPNNFPE